MSEASASAGPAVNNTPRVAAPIPKHVPQPQPQIQQRPSFLPQQQFNMYQQPQFLPRYQTGEGQLSQ